ncbi:transcription termination factor MTEF18, mitochondrial [Mercurialis annua]|uniref:transcription termination factor MTEF18, mitochondrial n=1 Tax=Mercurialis annua TaxID=3986 RepID=UPI00215F82A5|nr:transcription termination factor MTEF18, mitochondrial [Mercurialis annua]
MPISKVSLINRSFSSVGRKIPNLSKVPSKYKSKAIKEAQLAVTEYFHSTRSIPYSYAEHISNNSFISISNLIANVDWSHSNFSRSVRKFLSYHPINEFQFFYESIGINYNEVPHFLPRNKFFFYEDSTVLNAACALAVFGFPWIKLGTLYREDSFLFSKEPQELKCRLAWFKEHYGFSNTSVIGICLAFPCVLSGELGGEIDGLFADLKTVFLDFHLGSCVEGNVDAWFAICVKIRVFYDLGLKKGEVGNILGRSKNVFVDFTLEHLIEKIEYFCRFGVSKEDVGLLLLEKPEVLSFDLNTRLISVKGILKYFGLSDEGFEIVYDKYFHVLGRNKMANLPHVMRAMDLQVWFFHKIKDGDHKLLDSYTMDDPEEDFDKSFSDTLEMIRLSRTPIHTMSKVNFAHGIGFGENASNVKVLALLHGTGSELQERFDCLLHLGIEFSKLCVMIRKMPKILSQKSDILKKKVNFLRQEMGFSLQELDSFPAFLCYNLENRIKPRHRFHVWLTEKGLSVQKYSIASMVATSEKQFIGRIYRIHPMAAKHWFECFMPKTPATE